MGPLAVRTDLIFEPGPAQQIEPMRGNLRLLSQYAAAFAMKLNSRRTILVTDERTETWGEFHTTLFEHRYHARNFPNGYRDNQDDLGCLLHYSSQTSISVA